MLLFKKIKRYNPADKSAPTQWYPILKSMGLVKEKEVAKLLADETTLNPKEAEMAVSQLFKVVSTLLLNGKTVQLGELGSLCLKAQCKGVATEDDVSALQIKGLNVRFVASEQLKSELQKAVFKNVDSLVPNKK